MLCARRDPGDHLRRGPPEIGLTPKDCAARLVRRAFSATNTGPVFPGSRTGDQSPTASLQRSDLGKLLSGHAHRCKDPARNCRFCARFHDLERSPKLMANEGGRNDKNG